MLVEPSDVPTKAEFRAVVPKHCFKRNTAKSLAYAAASVLQSAACVAVGCMIPLRWAAAPLWLAYAAVSGTVWTGMWVIAHECGHGAFSDNRRLQDAVGAPLHSALLVPYFSWQHSHAVHHSRTNHITEGETHVPVVVGGREGIETPGGEDEPATRAPSARAHVGRPPARPPPRHRLAGLPALGRDRRPQVRNLQPLCAGARGSRRRCGNGSWPKRVWLPRRRRRRRSSAPSAPRRQDGRRAGRRALRAAPLRRQHVARRVHVAPAHGRRRAAPDGRGVRLCAAPSSPSTGRTRRFDWLHHRIGTTHVAHHIDCTIPHYHAREATDAMEEALPDGPPLRPDARPQGALARRLPRPSSCGPGRSVHVGARLTVGGTRFWIYCRTSSFSVRSAPHPRTCARRQGLEAALPSW